MLVNIFLYALQNVCRIMNTTASILCKNILAYLSLDMICSSKLTVFCNLEQTYVYRQIFVIIFTPDRGYSLHI